MSISGLTFADAWQDRVATNFDGILSHVIARSDLIACKRAAGRPQDLIDLTSLIESERLSGRSPIDPDTEP